MQKGLYCDLLTAFEKRYTEFKLLRKHLPRERLNKFWMAEAKPFAHALNSPSFTGKETLKHFAFTKPIYKTGDYVMMRKNFKFEYSRPEDLFGKKIGIIRGYKYGILDLHIKSKRIPTIAVNSSPQLYEMLSFGRLDAIIANKHVAPYEMRLKGIDSSQFVVSDASIYEFELMPLAHKSYHRFISKMNDFIDYAKESGLLSQLAAKYF